MLLPPGVRAQSPAAPAKAADRVPVLVELFTSEGCPHCPEADALLERLFTAQSVGGAEIVALEEHVDYWDRPAWTDHYASPAYTERQKNYADALELDSLYTPQMVIDGLMEFVGNSESRVRTAIATLGHAPKGVVQLKPQAPGAAWQKSPMPLRIAASIDLPAGHAASEVYMVVAEDKLFSRVQGGSNAGESWPHSSVARSFHRVGAIAEGQQHFSGTIEVGLPGDDGKWQNLRVILFAQEKDDRHVVAIRSARLAEFVPGAADAGAEAPPAAPKVAPVSSKPAGPAPR